MKRRRITRMIVIERRKRRRRMRGTVRRRDALSGTEHRKTARCPPRLRRLHSRGKTAAVGLARQGSGLLSIKGRRHAPSVCKRDSGNRMCCASGGEVTRGGRRRRDAAELRAAESRSPGVRAPRGGGTARVDLHSIQKARKTRVLPQKRRHLRLTRSPRLLPQGKSCCIQMFQRLFSALHLPSRAGGSVRPEA